MKKHLWFAMLSITLLGILPGCAPETRVAPEPTPMTNSPLATMRTETATTPATATLIPTIAPSATPEPHPTATATPLPPLPTARPTPTTIPAAQMQGEWRRITTADGLCTDSPRFIDLNAIGTETTMFCFPSGSLEDLTWSNMTAPQGTYVWAAGNFFVGSDLIVATDAGICVSDGLGGLGCVEIPEEKYADARQLTHIGPNRVYMLDDSVLYLVTHNEKLSSNYSLPEITSESDAYPTTMLAKENWDGKADEIWVATNGYGLVLIHPETREVTRFTTADGLPSNTIHSISARNTIQYPDDGVWIATDNGVGYWDRQQWKNFTVADGLPSNNVRGIVANRGVWIATDGGAAYFDGHVWQSFTVKNGGLPEGELTNVRVSDDTVWFSTRDQGLLIFTYQTEANTDND